MAEKLNIKKAIKHPGKEKRRAAAAGRSTHEQMVVDSHSGDPSTAAAGRMGLMLSGKSKAAHGGPWH